MFHMSMYFFRNFLIVTHCTFIASTQGHQLKDAQNYNLALWRREVSQCLDHPRTRTGPYTPHGSAPMMYKSCR